MSKLYRYETPSGAEMVIEVNYLAETRERDLLLDPVTGQFSLAMIADIDELQPRDEINE